MERILINSPAKINFGLNIIEKRSDGFHNLETIFYPLELCDKIIFEKSVDFSFTSNVASLEKDPTNLIIKALRLVEEFIGRKLNVKISLQKVIPIGGGLGGGSSNAAHTLLSLNELFELKIPIEVINTMSLQLGSDVPFFIKPITSFATSRGEILEPINFEIKKPLLLINPRIHISTKWAFQNIIPQKPKLQLKEVVRKDKSFISYRESIKNDFEEIVLKTYPELSDLKKKLYEFGADFVLMSGSGSTFFAIFSDHEIAEYAKKYYEKNYFCFLQLND
jgi:4-diphosphocytidyl-2-C-methyl-D-erythritol kinase